MKKNLMKMISGAVLAILMLAVFAQISVSAQTIIFSGETRRNTRSLEGSWDVQVTARNCQTNAVLRTFPAMITYMRGGTLHEFGIGSGLLRGPGHGTWTYQSELYFGQRYSSASQFFRFNADGTHAGKQINRAQIEVDGLGNSYTATTASEIYNPGGVLIATGCVTTTGTRFE